MFYNENYPWYLQSSPVFSKLYREIYDVAKDITPLDIWKLFYIDELPLANVREHASLWGIKGGWYGIRDALIYNVESWGNLETGEGKYWSGILGYADDEWYARYVKMKAYIQGKPFNNYMIKEAVAILIDKYPYTIEVIESNLSCEIKLTVDSFVKEILNGIISYDPNLFGKPVGIKVTYNFTQE